MKTKVFIFSGSLPWICTYIRLNYQIKIEIIKTNESFKFMSYDCRNQFSLKPLHLYGELQFEVRNDFELSCFINCVLRYFFFLWDTFLTVELLFVRDLISGLCFIQFFFVFFDFSLFVFFLLEYVTWKFFSTTYIHVTIWMTDWNWFCITWWSNQWWINFRIGINSRVPIVLTGVKSTLWATAGTWATAWSSRIDSAYPKHKNKSDFHFFINDSIVQLLYL